MSWQLPTASLWPEQYSGAKLAQDRVVVAAPGESCAEDGAGSVFSCRSELNGIFVFCAFVFSTPQATSENSQTDASEQKQHADNTQ